MTAQDGRRGVRGHRDSSQYNSVYNGQKRKYKKGIEEHHLETVSTLSKLLVKLKEISENKTKAISDLETAVIKMRAQCEDGREKCNKGRAAPSVTPSREPVGNRAQGHASPSVIFSQEPAGSRAQGAAPTGDRSESVFHSPREQHTTPTL
jgi:hypothetical protein